MTSILSSISGYFSRSLILGTVLPVTIFVVLSLLFLVPVLPNGLLLSTLLEGLDTGKIVGISFLTIVLSGLLYNINIPIRRLYQGYPWRRSWIGSWLTRRHIARFKAAEIRLESMRAVLRKMDEVGKDFQTNSTFVNEVIDNWRSLGSPLQQVELREQKWLKTWHGSEAASQLSQMKEQWRALSTAIVSEFSTYRVQVKLAYPEQPGLILPTRLGNAIRSFEYYSYREYGIDSVEIWPRLVAVIPTDYAVSIDDTKTTLDFMLNCSLLSAVLAIALFIIGVIYLPSFLAAGSLYWVFKIAALVCLSYFFYLLSVNSARSWGLLIKSAIDLYRWDLLKKLGYQQQLVTREAERAHWREVSRQAIYGDRFDKKLMAYVTPSLPATQLQQAQLTRGVKRDETSGVTTIYLRVKNTNPSTPLAGVTVTDRLSDEFDLEWDSAKIDGKPVNVSGTNPYEFALNEIAKGGEAVLTYQAIPKKSNRFTVALN